MTPKNRRNLGLAAELTRARADALILELLAAQGDPSAVTKLEQHLLDMSKGELLRVINSAVAFCSHIWSLAVNE